jgi:hypothetical protein
MRFSKAILHSAAATRPSVIIARGVLLTPHCHLFPLSEVLHEAPRCAQKKAPPRRTTVVIASRMANVEWGRAGARVNRES